MVARVFWAEYQCLKTIEGKQQMELAACLLLKGSLSPGLLPDFCKNKRGQKLNIFFCN